ncbi:YecA family protein [Atlantibacter sp.]|uniref:YecA/YgfB family protein n=1 Tax=Atlantibacter sp. TaxID=1903473 RepID=UPI00289BAF98|nr:YecA family protein [Atlantibacter sp.]
MNQGPLNEKELEWLDGIFAKYASDRAVVDVSELDGMLTALLSGPSMPEPSEWLVAVWGGADSVPKWHDAREMECFMNLVFQHMEDISDRLSAYPDQYEPLFGAQDVEGEEYMVVEDWCYGYLRGVALSDWSTLPESHRMSLESIELHGREENQASLENMTPEAYQRSIDDIRLAALSLYEYWSEHQHPEPVAPAPYIAETKVGRNDPCPCGSGKKYKSCCLH